MAVDGTWNVTVQSPMGAQKSVVTLKNDGGALTGTAAGAQGSMDIANGKADGDNVSWSMAITTPFPMTLDFAGKVDGDNLNGNVKAGSFGSFPFTGTRG
ncbi:MAG TPA: hypothetical protein VGG10_21835 [Rhizomicrobium sp.]